MTNLSLQKPLIEVDQCLVLHLAVTPVTCPVGRIVLLRQFYAVLGAVHADRDAAL